MQSAENTSTFDLDLDQTTTFREETSRERELPDISIVADDWSASVGLNYRLGTKFSLDAAGARGFKTPALDDFLNAKAEEQEDLFVSKEAQLVEGGVKGISLDITSFNRRWFLENELKNVVSQGRVIDSVTGTSSRWIDRPFA